MYLGRMVVIVLTLVTCPGGMALARDGVAEADLAEAEDVAGRIWELTRLASRLYEEGDYRGAQEFLEKILAELGETWGEEHPFTLTAKHNLAITLRMQGDFHQAQMLSEEVLASRSLVLGEDNPATLRSKESLASTLWDLGDFNLARKMFEEIVASRSRVLGKDHPETARAKASLASTLAEQGDFAWAKEILEEILENRSRSLEKNPQDVLRWKENLANILWKQGDLQRAREIYEDVLAAFRQILHEDHPDTLRAKANLASAFKAQGHFARAREMLEEVLAVQVRVFGKSHPDTLKVMHNLASTLRSQNDLEGARSLFEEILRIRRSIFKEDYRPDTVEELANLYFLALIYRDLGESKRAANFFRQALDALEGQVGKVGDSENLKSTFKSGFEIHYREALETLIDLGRTEEAFHVFERFRAQGFLAMLSTRGVAFEEIPPEIVERRLRLRRQYDATTRHRDRLNPMRHKRSFDKLLRRQTTLRRERELLDAEIGRLSPKGAVLKPLETDEIQRSLEPGTLMLAYFVGPERTHLFTLARDSGVTAHTIDVGEATLFAQYLRFSGQLRGPSHSDLGASRAEMAFWLYDKLIGPVEEQVAKSRRLVIVPDGPLYYIPFASLARPDGKYLVETIPIHYAASATVYVHLVRQRRSFEFRRSDRLHIALFGNPTYPQGQVAATAWLQALPFTESEVTAIAREFPDMARVFLGTAATEENAASFGKNAWILHIAAHGMTDPFTPLDSFIALTIPGAVPAAAGGSRENGLLQAWEILERVRLKADLVVLSACQSSYGPEVDGDGLQSLSRAFQIAGARTVVASLWSVNDESTAELMVRFYRHLREGKPKDEALRAAQIEFIYGPGDYSSPYYWAAFQVIGDWRSSFQDMKETQ